MGNNKYRIIIDNIFENYRAYYEHLISRGATEVRNAEYYYKKLLEDDILIDIAITLKSKISDKLFYRDFSLLYQHGDLHLQNILLSSDGITSFID